MASSGKTRRKGKLIFTTDLVSWLNQTSPRYQGRPTKASRERILALRAAIESTCAELSAAARAEPTRSFWENPPEAVQEGLDAVQEMLDRYPQWPMVEILGEDGSGGLDINYATGAGMPLGEQVAAWGIIELAKSRRLHLLRQCLCGAWFLAKKSDHKSHSPACRHKIYEQTDAFKAKRSVYMREYNALKSSGKVK
jgi:hypothetical protein